MAGLLCTQCGGDLFEPDHDRWCKPDRGEPAPEPAFNPRAAFGPSEDPPARVVTITSPRETSIRAFYAAIDAGVIETRRAQVYVGLEALGVATYNEVYEHLKQMGQMRGLRYDSNTHARVTELRDLGLIREVGERPCRVTGQTCITWEVVPESEYAGMAIIHRCDRCGQITGREIPIRQKA
jgi:hypothetical protein